MKIEEGVRRITHVSQNIIVLGLLSTLKNAVRFSCLAAFSTGYSFFLTSSTSFGKSSEIPRLRPFVRFLMKDLINSLSWKLESLTIIGRGFGIRSARRYSTS